MLRVARVDLDARGPVTLERWQLRDVIEGRVSQSDTILHLAAQAFARDALRTTLPALARATRVRPDEVSVAIERLRAAGWWTSDGVLTAERPASRPTQPTGPAGALISPPASDHATATPAVAPATSQEARGAPPPVAPGTQPMFRLLPADEPREAAVPRRPSATSPPIAGSNAAVEALARDLVAQYPHGAWGSGRTKRPSPTPIARALRAVFNGCPRPDREALEAAIRAGCDAERRAAPPEGDVERRFVPALGKWVAEHGWEAPPTFQRAPAELRAPVSGGGAEARAASRTPDARRQGPGWTTAPARASEESEEARERWERTIRDRHRATTNGGGT